MIHETETPSEPHQRDARQRCRVDPRRTRHQCDHLGRTPVRGAGRQDPAVRAERLRRLSALQKHFDALPVDEAVAVSYGRLAAAVADAGRQPRGRVMDLLIAATAHAHDARLYTRNISDFAGLEDLVDITAV